MNDVFVWTRVELELLSISDSNCREMVGDTAELEASIDTSSPMACLRTWSSPKNTK